MNHGYYGCQGITPSKLTDREIGLLPPREQKRLGLR